MGLKDVFYGHVMVQEFGDLCCHSYTRVEATSASGGGGVQVLFSVFNDLFSSYRFFFVVVYKGDRPTRRVVTNAQF